MFLVDLKKSAITAVPLCVKLVLPSGYPIAQNNEVQMAKEEEVTQTDKTPLIVRDEAPSTSNDTRLLSPTADIKVYKTRWLMLFLFSLNTLLNGSMFMGLSSMVEVVAPYYDVSAVHIEWLSNLFMIVFVFVCLPSAYIMSRFGVRTVLTIVAGLDTVAASLQYAGTKENGFQFVMVGQIFAAIAYGNLIQIPGKLSALWFPLHERGLSTSIGVFTNIMGMAVGFVQPSNMIPVTENPDQIMIGLKHFFVSKLVLAILIFVATGLIFREKPPSPPSVIDDDKPEMGFMESLKVLVKDKYFVIMSQAYGIYFGLFVSVAVVVSQLVIWQFGAETGIQHIIGWMGFTWNVTAIIGCFVIGLYLDRYSHHQGVAIFLNAGSFILWLIFIMVLTKTKHLIGLFIVYALYGVFGIPYFASGLEQAAEMTSPVPEGTSSTVVLLLGNIYGFVLIFTLGALIEDGYPLTSVYLILGLYLLSTILVCVAKTKLKRSEAESASTLSINRPPEYGSENETEKFVNIVTVKEKE